MGCHGTEMLQWARGSTTGGMKAVHSKGSEKMGFK